MAKQPIISYINKLPQAVFTTSELSQLSGKSASAVTQALNYLAKNGLVLKICRGVWGKTGDNKISIYAAITRLLPHSRAYVSFLSALHLYGIIEQIPQVVTLASLSHTKMLRIKLGIIFVHQIAPKFFCGFQWYKGTGSFLIAEPEKALVDCLYLSACKKRQFTHFPELYFPKSFSFKKAKIWARLIPNPKTRLNAQKKLSQIAAQGPAAAEA